MRKVRKGFAGVEVLKGVDFDVNAGEVHALVGSNGAGKSTLMKILDGVHVPDAGTVEIDGLPVTFGSASDAQKQGIAMVFQELSLIPALTVAQNVFLTKESRTRYGLVDDGAAERETSRILEEMGVDLEPSVEVGKLPSGYRQLVEIAKALSRHARVLIMDEPTSSLAKDEVESFFALVHGLRERGIAVVYISHRMDEVFAIADRITVLRDGLNVQTKEVSQTTISDVIEQMVGRRVERTFAWEPRFVDRSGPPLLEARALRAGSKVRGIDLRVARGEIVGLAGLMGSGRSELVQALFGVNPIEAGEVRVNGELVRIRSPRDALRAGIALIPESRHVEGLVLGHSVGENLVLPHLRTIEKRGFLSEQAGVALARAAVDELNIRTDSLKKLVDLLSGGNQQKVVIGKWLAMNPEILLMDEPTAGIDVATKAEIILLIRQLAHNGAGVVLVSSEFAELLALSDRIVVLRDGEAVKQFDRGLLDEDGDTADLGESIGLAEERLHAIVQQAA